MIAPSGNGARVALVRAEPKTLEDHLSRGYAARFKLDGSDSEPVDDVVKRLRGSKTISRAAMQAMRDRLVQVQDRCVVSLVHREMLDQVLSDELA